MLKERASTREQKNVAKRQCCLGSIEGIVLSLSAGGITHGEIAARLADIGFAGLTLQAD